MYIISQKQQLGYPVRVVWHRRQQTIYRFTSRGYECATDDVVSPFLTTNNGTRTSRKSYCGSTKSWRTSSRSLSNRGQVSVWPTGVGYNVASGVLATTHTPKITFTDEVLMDTFRAGTPWRPGGPVSQPCPAACCVVCHGPPAPVNNIPRQTTSNTSHGNTPATALPEENIFSLVSDESLSSHCVTFIRYKPWANNCGACAMSPAMSGAVNRAGGEGGDRDRWRRREEGDKRTSPPPPALQYNISIFITITKLMFFFFVFPFASILTRSLFIYCWNNFYLPRYFMFFLYFFYTAIINSQVSLSLSPPTAYSVTISPLPSYSK